MKRTYTIPEAKREEIEKIIARYQKKSAKYGAALTVEYGEPYAKEYAIRELDPVTHTLEYVHGCMGHVLTEKFEVFDLTIDSDIIRKDGYTIAAKIEHLDGGNVVSANGCECKREWTKMKPFCEHCNSNHGLRVTFIVRHEDGTEKQVGRTCLKDYCGIDPQAVGMANEMHDIIYGLEAERYDFLGNGVRPAIDVEDALALAAKIQRTKGYTQSSQLNSNKDMLYKALCDNEDAEQKDVERAKEIISKVKAMTQDEAVDACLNNVKSLIECGYCKSSHLGYIAYAPLALERWEKKVADKAAREAAKNAERGSSEFVGEVGKRIEINVADMKLITSWEGQWGWTYLYKIVDTDSNILMWFASKEFGRWDEAEQQYVEYKNVKKLLATVKDHNERDGVKQTIITRCKYVA